MAAPLPDREAVERFVHGLAAEIAQGLGWAVDDVNARVELECEAGKVVGFSIHARKGVRLID